MTAIGRLIGVKPFSSEFGVFASYKYLAKLSWRGQLIATVNQIPAPLNIPHALTAGELLVRVGASIANGLTDD
jgi:hypothetical protein